MSTNSTPLPVSFAVGSLPLVAYILAGAAISYAAIELFEGETAVLIHDLERGDLARAQLETHLAHVERMWGVLIVSLMAVFALHGAVTLRAWRRVRDRVERAEAFVAASVSGVPQERLVGGRRCSLGRLEETIMQVSETLSRREAAIEADAWRQRLQGQLSRALELLDEEGEIHELTAQAVKMAVGDDRPAELLLADSSEAHLRRVARAEGPGRRSCSVASPHGCAAVRRGTTLSFSDSGELDACPRLRDHGGEPCSATCAPVSVMGRTIGVIHTTGPVGATLDQARTDALTMVATQVGARLGMVRTLADTRLQARTDGLTGLLNRRSFEDEVEARLRAGGEHCVILADLDHFKRLNDTHGHAVGDRALTLFSRVVQERVRPGDVVGRYGGEEFVLLLDDCSLEVAASVLQRLRDSLQEAIQLAGLPPFSVSMGLARWGRDGADLPSLLRVADAALYQAKEAGRDRVVVAGADPSQPLVGPMVAEA